ncbi:FAD binding domain-containing protein [Colletotrichum karsti]|uniref:FAD binding domain-containing protein n=1 Tax=Colletotrichum karsti TaxID=1095194 RepID=A0A9P6IDN7_9PEZI|nr:FAD binding domain-containing protein [Colletotrichum karsti]KAF9880462.1 FAD binding domain-containing protein [Colletotrichum karsti]
MEANKDMRILIAGGSVAGLSLAIMLEKFGIDYLILEAYSEMAPQLGASIGMLPNGLQILDQLGCYDRLREIGGDVYYKSSMRASDGRILTETKGTSLSERVEEKTGYPCVFIDRQMLLQVLYEKIQHKERVLTGKRVVHVEFDEAGVTVKTKDGSTYSGDILVGADGVRSTVRQEMWRLAADESPGAFPPNEAESLNSRTKCIFGISNQPKGWRGMQHSVFYDGRSYLLVPGPEGRVYWFFFHVMDRDYYGKDIPRFSKEDEAKLAFKHLDDAISDTIKFRDIYEGRRFSTLVALEEHVFSRWHYRRIVLIGDSAHKLHPITAQGGNGALETAAVLTNALIAKLRSSQHKLSEDEIESVLAEVQAGRIDNITAAMKEGRWSNAIVCQQLPLAELLIRIVIPWLGDGLMFNSWVKAFEKGTRVKALDVPQRVVGKLSHGKADSQSQARNWAKWVSGAAISGLAAFMIMRLRKI